MEETSMEVSLKTRELVNQLRLEVEQLRHDVGQRQKEETQMNASSSQSYKSGFSAFNPLKEQLKPKLTQLELKVRQLEAENELLQKTQWTGASVSLLDTQFGTNNKRESALENESVGVGKKTKSVKVIMDNLQRF